MRKLNFKRDKKNTKLVLVSRDGQVLAKILNAKDPSIAHLGYRFGHVVHLTEESSKEYWCWWFKNYTTAKDALKVYFQHDPKTEE